MNNSKYEISLEEILSCNLGELTEVMYTQLKEMNATSDDEAEINFGNSNFDGRLIIKLKEPLNVLEEIKKIPKRDYTSMGLYDE